MYATLYEIAPSQYGKLKVMAFVMKKLELKEFTELSKNEY